MLFLDNDAIAALIDPARVVAAQDDAYRAFAAGVGVCPPRIDVQSAEGDGARFRQVLVEYNRAPAVTRDRMYLETMQTVFTNASKVMVDTRTNNSLLYLPLDKLIQSTAPGAAPTGVPAPAASASQPTDVPAPLASGNATQDPRSRDGGRSRDRDGR